MRRRLDAASAPQSWRHAAACRAMGPELFFPPDGPEGREWDPEPARAVCERCPVRGDCLDWAVASGQSHGVWGGATEKELRRLRRRMAARAS